MTVHSSILVWRIRGQRPGGLDHGHKESDRAGVITTHHDQKDRRRIYLLWVFPLKVPKQFIFHKICFCYKDLDLALALFLRVLLNLKKKKSTLNHCPAHQELYKFTSSFSEIATWLLRQWNIKSKCPHPDFDKKKKKKKRIYIQFSKMAK